MSWEILNWLVLLIIPVVSGVTISFLLKSWKALPASAVTPWLACLPVVIYGEKSSPDAEILQGSWPVFQLIFGTWAALVAIVSSAVTLRLLRKRSN